MQRRYTCNGDIHATKINMQRRYICNGDIYATKIYMQQGYICNEETHLVESTADDDIAAGLNNCVGRAQLGPNLLAPNLVKICEGLCFVFCVLCFVFWSRYVRDCVLYFVFCVLCFVFWSRYVFCSFPPCCPPCQLW